MSTVLVAGSGIGRNRHTAGAGTPDAGLRRCLTCKLELSADVERYCSDACCAKFGLSKRAPGRTAARRHRRRGGRKG